MTAASAAPTGVGSALPHACSGMCAGRLNSSRTKSALAMPKEVRHHPQTASMTNTETVVRYQLTPAPTAATVSAQRQALGRTRSRHTSRAITA